MADSQTYKLSPSSLSLMQECSRCFWMEKHKVWSRPSGPMSTLPMGMDKLLKIADDLASAQALATGGQS